MNTKPLVNELLARIGWRYLSPTGTIWTLQSVHRDGTRVLLLSPDNGVRGAVVDVGALDRMLCLEPATSAVGQRVKSPPMKRASRSSSTVAGVASMTAAQSSAPSAGSYPRARAVERSHHARRLAQMP